ncbi:hypothetical protein ANACOL_02363 [Anaerotruncus colihominis DSM 17241]|uniref:Uncharacterized protein n=1 Tax=Anaerotruncus colihominis DSM 17241 TaxID=445972 RepID=B0PC54_9FIRM|nr:hypothetical protein ANACOL_02363 [Anaerotruncus colihominis DSM 17241]OUO66724.1 hypothetical protein B5F55_12015 [Anaerotruncus colihominis]
MKSPLLYFISGSFHLQRAVRLVFFCSSRRRQAVHHFFKTPILYSAQIIYTSRVKYEIIEAAGGIVRGKIT